MRQIDIERFESYQITDDGRVYSKKKGNFLKPLEGRYYHIHLCKNGVVYTKSIHRLVAEAFIPNPNNLPIVDHIDGDTHNNNVNNLRWCTTQFNNSTDLAKERKRKALKGKIPIEAIKAHAQNTAQKVYQYTLEGELVNIYESAREAARQTKFPLSSIQNCCKGMYYSRLRKKYYTCKTYKGYKWSYIPL